MSGGIKRRPSSVMRFEEGFNAFDSGIVAGWNIELHSRRFHLAVLGEFMATFIFVAMGVIVCMYTVVGSDPLVTFTPNSSTDGLPVISQIIPNSIARWFGIASVFGIMITILVFIFGNVSGANINPAVSCALMVSGKMSLLRGIFYILAQCSGAMLGALFARSLSPDMFIAAGGAINALNTSRDWLSTWTAFGGEIMGTLLLVFTVCAAADADREVGNKYVGGLTPVMIGFAVLCSHIFLIPIDGCSINPARSFGASVALASAGYGSLAFKDHWVFWIAPILGGVLTAIIYRVAFKDLIFLDEPVTPVMRGSSIRKSNSNDGIGSVVTTPIMDPQHSLSDVSRMDSLDLASISGLPTRLSSSSGPSASLAQAHAAAVVAAVSSLPGTPFQSPPATVSTSDSTFLSATKARNIAVQRAMGLSQSQSHPADNSATIISVINSGSSGSSLQEGTVLSLNPSTPASPSRPENHSIISSNPFSNN